MPFVASKPKPALARMRDSIRRLQSLLATVKPTLETPRGKSPLHLPEMPDAELHDDLFCFALTHRYW